MKQLHTFFFSPTGGSEKVANILTKEFGYKATMYDLTDPNLSCADINQDDLAIFIIPSFAGRCPELAINNLGKFKGLESKAIIVTTFGNRAYDDTLIELYDKVKKLGFIPIAALAIVTKHSIFPMFATNRPDQDDEKWIKDAVIKIKEKLETTDVELSVSGNHPYKELHPNPLKPIVDNNKCTQCGLCAKTCPALAVDKDNPNTTDYNKCISCMRCLNICPTKARYLDNEKYNAVYNRLLPMLKDRKENSLFL